MEEYTPGDVSSIVRIILVVSKIILLRIFEENRVKKGPHLNREEGTQETRSTLVRSEGTQKIRRTLVRSEGTQKIRSTLVGSEGTQKIRGTLVGSEVAPQGKQKCSCCKREDSEEMEYNRRKR